MVFSLFRKPQKKMPERQSARPQPAAAPDIEPPKAEIEPVTPVTLPESGEGMGISIDIPAQSRDEAFSLDSADLEMDDPAFGDDGNLAILVDEMDPFQADIEQASVLFANGQDTAARTVLEASAQAHADVHGERIWRMLLDLLQVLGDRPAFERVALEFARICETSPPTWRIRETPDCPAGDGDILAMGGVISGADAPEIRRLRAALAGRRPLRLDFSRLAGCDNAAAGALGALLGPARRQAVGIVLEGMDGLVGRLETRCISGQREAAGSWLLLLELYQYLGRQELFEEKAVDYAVTFEVSPPSWETAGPLSKNSKPLDKLSPPDSALVLAGELKNYSFPELSNYLDACEYPILDFSRVKRLDFSSAGLLRNALEACQQQGKEVVIRHPHHVVAELMGIVGLHRVARIIVPKY